MQSELIPPFEGANLTNYEDMCKEFTWASLEKEFEWSNGAPYNIAYEAIDRHAKGWRKNKIAIYWEGADGSTKKYTFREMQMETNRFANALLKLGTKKGDRVFVYLDRIPELYIAAIGTIKMGAIVGPLFSALGPDGVKDRLLDAGARTLVTTPELYRRIQPTLDELTELSNIIVVTDDEKLVPTGCISFNEFISSCSPDFRPVSMDPNDPYVVHYTSGTTGKPKGVLLGHKSMIQQFFTSRIVLDLQEEDTYWCTADPGWVTGTSYGIIGPWLLGASIVSYEGRFDARVWYRILEKYGITVWYTAPTALRMLMKAGDDIVKEFDLSKLRHICSVGEPLNPEVVRWGVRVLKKRIHDTWWQTETGAMLICNYPCQNIKPGSMGRPIPGVQAAVVDDDGQELPPGREGYLAIRPGWPSMMVGIWRNAPKYREYFRIPGWYVAGDMAYRDEEGYFWFLGRADDVIKSSGERIGPFEVESVLLEHPAVAEAGVIGKPDEIRGEIVKAFISLRPGFTPSEELKEDIAHFVKQKLAAYAYPREIEFVDRLPKTRSGKILRRVLRARELGLDVGDLSTLEE
ncbi:MAG: acetate--CoA ligase [Methanomassiliicoccales archaeon]|nr:acetate--CoA ligase [Methanomassiliicoccales archaeon]